MSEKLISVIIPMYNRRDKICRSMDSVFNQSYCAAIGEIIVIDDGSSDDSVEVVHKYSQANNGIDIIIIEQANHGASHARNRGLAVAKYDYVAFLDSDDEWLPNKTSDQLKIFEEYPDADFVGGNWEKTPIRILNKKITTLHKATLRELCIKSFPVTPSVLMKKAIFDCIGGFDESICFYEDCDYFQRICAAGYGYYFIPTQLVVCDRGKNPFGESGLSANLKAAHKDSIISIKKLRDSRCISGSFYLFLRVFYLVKYIRRVLLSSWFRKNRK